MKKKRNMGGGGGEVAAIDQLPDELAVEILSRVGSTLNEAARCSVLSKRWRDLWKLIDGGVLDFDEDARTKAPEFITPRKQQRFANRVDQALKAKTSSLDELRIVYDLLGMEEEAWRWIKFGLTNRVKRLTLLSRSIFKISLSRFTPASLCSYDVNRLEVLELEGLFGIPQGALEYIFSNCPSLRRFALVDSDFKDDGPQRLAICCSSNNIQSLTFSFPAPLPAHAPSLAGIELVSAPGLQFLEVCAYFEELVLEFKDDLPQLQEVRFGGPWINSENCILTPTPRANLAPRLQHLGLKLCHYSMPSPQHLLCGNFTVLDLHIELTNTPPSLLECTSVLTAAPMLRHLSIWFLNLYGPTEWHKQDRYLPTRRHPSLQLLHLYGVHPRPKEGRADPRHLLLEVAAHIIRHAPSLTHVLIDTLRIRTTFNCLPPQQRELLDALHAKSELEAQLLLHPRCTTSTHNIHFTYQ